jgi:hypothetical protein
VVAFSGIESLEGPASLRLIYKNVGKDASVAVLVNQAVQGNFELRSTHNIYEAATLEIRLSAGRNFISLAGGTVDLRYEALYVNS